MGNVVTYDTMDGPSKTSIALSSKSLRKRVTASQSQVIDEENMSSIAMSASSSCSQVPISRKVTQQDCDNIFEDEVPDANDSSFSIDKDASLSTDVDGSTTDDSGGSSPKKYDADEDAANVVMETEAVVNGHGRLSPPNDNILSNPGQNDDEEDVVGDLINSDGSIDEVWNEGSKSGTKRSSVTEAESSSKKIRLYSADEKIKTDSKDNREIAFDKHGAGSPDENSDSMPNTSNYFSELEKSVLEQVSSIVVDDDYDKKEKDSEVLTQGSLSIEHLLKVNNCPLCLKWSDKIVVHVKNCAAKKKVTSDKLFDAIKLQLKQHQEREAIGLPPLLQQPPPKKKGKKKAASSVAAVPEGYDSSIELAKALSASSMESQESFGNVDAENCIDNSATLHTKDDNTKKSAFIFGSASGSSSGTGKFKGGSTLLFNRSEEDRERIVTEKVAIVLLHSDDQDNLITETAPVIPSSSTMKENLNKRSTSPKPRLKTADENSKKLTQFNCPIAVRKMNKTSRSFRNNWRDIFKNRVMCDVIVVVEDGFEIEVHKLVLRAQCPAILDEIIACFTADNIVKNFINWNTIPKDVASAFFQYIYCEDLSNANSLAEDGLKIFMDVIDKYDITGLKFIMKDAQITNELDIPTHSRDIDEATTATNSSGDELNNALVIENAAENDCRVPNSSPSDRYGMLNDFEDADFCNSIRTQTVDKSKVVKYPFKKRASHNIDLSSCVEITETLPSFSNISIRSRRSRKSNNSNRSPKVSVTIDCNSVESFEEVQIIGEQKKSQQSKSAVVITLSDDSDDGTVCSPGTGAKKHSTVTRPREGSGIGCKRMYESTDSKSEENEQMEQGTWNDAFDALKTLQNNSELMYDVPPKSREESFENAASLEPSYFDSYGYRRMVPKSVINFDPQMPSTSKAADLFEEWVAKCPTKLLVENSTASQKNNYENFGEQQFNEMDDRGKPITSEFFCENNRDSCYNDFEAYHKPKSPSSESQAPTVYKFLSQLCDNPPLMNSKVNCSNVFGDEHGSLWMNDDDQATSARDITRKTFQSSLKEPNPMKNRRKRHCSATITSSQLDASAGDTAKIMRKSTKITDAGCHDNAVKTKSNVSLLNVDDDIFENVQTPDTSARNDTPKVNSDKLVNKTDGLNNADPPLVDKYSEDKMWHRPVAEPLIEFPMAPVNEVTVPYENVLPIAPEPENDVPIEQVDEVPIEQVYQAPIEQANEAPIEQANEVPVERVNEPPIAQIAPVNEAPVAPINVASNELQNVVAAQADQVNDELILEPVHLPKPNFSKMKKCELMEQLETFGVKTNMTAVRARRLLTHIYEFTHQELKIGKGKKMTTKKAYDPVKLRGLIDEEQRLYGFKNERRIPEAAADVGPAPGPNISHNAALQNEEELNQARLLLFEQEVFNGGDALSDTYRELLELEVRRVIINNEEFECPTCFDSIEAGGGIVLKDCAHSICRTCLSRLVESNDEALIKCPCCPSIIQEREIKEVVAPEVFERYLSKSIAITANSIENAFHCRTPDCRGWCIIDDVINQPVNVFQCPLCLIANCIQCQATHPSMNCLQYQNHLAIQAEKDPIAKKSLLYLEKLKMNKKALNCPKCQIIIVKTEGCDWIQCSMCKCEICWATMGPRWGPKGHGDESGGCGCKLNQGRPCTAKCRNCH